MITRPEPLMFDTWGELYIYTFLTIVCIHVLFWLYKILIYRKLKLRGETL